VAGAKAAEHAREHTALSEGTTHAYGYDGEYQNESDADDHRFRNAALLLSRYHCLNLMNVGWIKYIKFAIEKPFALWFP
jgi:hypothetical protein